MFVTAIHADVPFSGLHEYLCGKLANWGLGLDGGEYVLELEDVPNGTYALVPPGAHEGKAWHRAVHPCPFVAPLAGYLEWQWWDDQGVMGSLPRALFFAGRGRTVNLADGRMVDAVALRRLPLADLFGKWSLDDGDALLTRDDGAYQDYVVATVERAIEAAGCTAYLGWMSTCHNPLRFSWVQAAGQEGMVPAIWEVRGGERRLVDPDVALGSFTVDLWTLDFAVLGDRDFWAPP